jgi:hypothetical protein
MRLYDHKETKMKQPDRSEVKTDSNQPEVLHDLAVTQEQAEETKAGTVTVTGMTGTFRLTFNGQTTA